MNDSFKSVECNSNEVALQCLSIEIVTCVLWVMLSSILVLQYTNVKTLLCYFCIQRMVNQEPSRVYFL